MKNEKYELKRRQKKLDVDIKNDVFIGNIPNNVRRKNLLFFNFYFNVLIPVLKHKFFFKKIF